MNFFVLFLTILFTLLGTFTCAVVPQSSNSVKQNDSNIGQEGLEGSSTLLDERKLNDDLDDHAGDHDQDQKIVPRKGVNNSEADSVDAKVPEKEHPNHSITSDRASTTITKDNVSQKNGTSELSTSTNAKQKVTNSSKVDKYSPSESKPSQTETSHTSSNYSKSEYASTSNTSKSSATKSTESASTNTSKSSLTQSTESASSKSSSFNKKPLVTYSVEDDPSLLNVPMVRELTQQLTPINTQAEADYGGYISSSSDFASDRMQTSKGALYIFPLVVLIFLVPMVLGIGIIVVRRVRDYWSTRHYRRMDFLVDGMYNT